MTAGDTNGVKTIYIKSSSAKAMLDMLSPQSPGPAAFERSVRRQLVPEHDPSEGSSAIRCASRCCSGSAVPCPVADNDSGLVVDTVAVVAGDAFALACSGPSATRLSHRCCSAPPWESTASGAGLSAVAVAYCPSSPPHCPSLHPWYCRSLAASHRHPGECCHQRRGS